MRDVQQANSPDPSDFRRVMGLFTTGVCVVSIPGGEAGVSAMTVNSLVSVSLDPMLVCWSLQNSASQFAQYVDAERFAISILAEGQDMLAQRYAARGDSLLRADDFVASAAGIPVIADSLGHIECRRWSHYEAGDHTLIFGEVTGLGADGLEAVDLSPLGFFKGRFCSIGE